MRHSQGRWTEDNVANEYSWLYHFARVHVSNIALWQPFLQTALTSTSHVAFLVNDALPQGTKDSLDHNDDPDIPEGVEFTFYGPVTIQGSLRKYLDGTKSTIIADAYTWFANEALWTEKCGLTFGLAQTGDDEDPKYGGVPGQDPDSDESDD